LRLRELEYRVTVCLRDEMRRGVVDLGVQERRGHSYLADVGLEHGPRRFGALRTRLQGVSPKVLTQTQGAQTQARESVNGTDCYRITGKVDKGVVSALIPGINQDVTATLWVTADSRNLPVKASFAVPGSGGSQGATVDVTFSNVNQPVTVTAPAG